MFKDHIKPFAYEICNHLSQHCLKCMQNIKKKDEQYDDGTLNVLAVFHSMRRILGVVLDDPQALHQVEKAMHPCLLWSL